MPNFKSKTKGLLSKSILSMFALIIFGIAQDITVIFFYRCYFYLSFQILMIKFIRESQHQDKNFYLLRIPSSSLAFKIEKNTQILSTNLCWNYSIWRLPNLCHERIKKINQANPTNNWIR